MNWNSFAVVTLSAALFTSVPVFSQAKKPIKTLRDIEVLVAALGDWEGVGVGFDVVKGELAPPQSFRDDWSSDFKKGDLIFEMTGLVKRGGIELPYAWTFNFKDKDNITASYEMATNQKGTLGVKVIAGGKRVQLFPIENQRGIDMTIDIYFEDDDLLIESQVRNIEGELVYQSATRYQKITVGE